MELGDKAVTGRERVVAAYKGGYADRVPAYPIAAVVLGAFVVYEVVRATRTHSIALPIFAAIDVLIIIFVVREYRELRRQRATAS